MPRQRSKKLSASRKTEQTSNPDPEPEQEEAYDESDSESSRISEKDEDEDELERLVLGDGATFKAQLGMDTEVNEYGDFEENGLVEGDLEEEAGLENVDDADVSSLPA
jgi:U3 small nucleolar RNA-associated protein 18